MLSVKDAAAVLGVCEKTARRYISTGRLPAVKINGRFGPALYLYEADVEAFGKVGTPLDNSVIVPGNDQAVHGSDGQDAQNVTLDNIFQGQSGPADNQLKDVFEAAGFPWLEMVKDKEKSISELNEKVSVLSARLGYLSRQLEEKQESIKLLEAGQSQVNEIKVTAIRSTALAAQYRLAALGGIVALIALLIFTLARIG